MGKGSDIGTTQWGKVGAWKLRAGKGEEGEATLGGSGETRRDAGMLSMDHKAPVAFRMNRAPEAVGPHPLRAEAPNLRQAGSVESRVTS